MALNDKLSRRVYLGLLAILVLVLFRYGLIPFYQWRDETIQEIKTQQKSLERKKTLVGRENRITRELEQAKKAFAAAAEFYYQGFADIRALQLRLQQELERLAKTCGVEIKSSDWLYPSEGYIIQVPIKVTCVAEPGRIIKFIYLLESAKHFFSIDRLEMVPNRRSATMNVELVISAYQLMAGGQAGG